VRHLDSDKAEGASPRRFFHGHRPPRPSLLSSHAVTYPPLAGVLGVRPPSGGEWLLVRLLGLVPAVLDRLSKSSP
jgi:hypothetical protein